MIPPGTVIGKVNAVDVDMTDRNNQIFYFLETTANGKFAVDVETGLYSGFCSQYKATSFEASFWMIRTFAKVSLIKEDTFIS